VDAETGEEVWKTKLGDINRGESMTMAPIVVNGKVLVGNSGGEFGVRGWITALDAGSGEIVWRAYNTGPDEDVLIGERFQPFYEADRGPDLGVTTWPPDQWRIGGRRCGAGSRTIPSSTSSITAPRTRRVEPGLRPGDNKWGSSIFARDPDTGEAVWAYQFVPHDEHDYDAINENILVDMEWEGRERKLLLRPERNGFIYVMDRETGEVLAADPFGLVTWAERHRPGDRSARS
jgi:lanthanide-dependent methanol dehydrogenase